ncbi:hypothetical protein K470DRAFT_259517, partial [Piedraia hortae CBS 480.64]
MPPGNSRRGAGSAEGRFAASHFSRFSHVALDEPSLRPRETDRASHEDDSEQTIYIGIPSPSALSRPRLIKRSSSLFSQSDARFSPLGGEVRRASPLLPPARLTHRRLSSVDYYVEEVDGSEEWLPSSGQEEGRDWGLLAPKPLRPIRPPSGADSGVGWQSESEVGGRGRIGGEFPNQMQGPPQIAVHTVSHAASYGASYAVSHGALLNASPPSPQHHRGRPSEEGLSLSSVEGEKSTLFPPFVSEAKRQISVEERSALFAERGRHSSHVSHSSLASKGSLRSGSSVLSSRQKKTESMFYPHVMPRKKVQRRRHDALMEEDEFEDQGEMKIVVEKGDIPIVPRIEFERVGVAAKKVKDAVRLVDREKVKPGPLERVMQRVGEIKEQRLARKEEKRKEDLKKLIMVVS